MTPDARRSGRRPGESSARDDILEAARAAFAEHGYDRATIRGHRRAGRRRPSPRHPLLRLQGGAVRRGARAARPADARCSRAAMAAGARPDRRDHRAHLPRGVGRAGDAGAPHGHAAFGADQRGRHGHDPRPAGARGVRADHGGARRAGRAATGHARRLPARRALDDAVHRPHRAARVGVRGRPGRGRRPDDAALPRERLAAAPEEARGGGSRDQPRRGAAGPTPQM